MDKHRTPAPPRDDARPRPHTKNKENPLADTVYLIQNENQVLRMKNGELNIKIRELKLQLQANSDAIARLQKDIESIRSGIKTHSYKEDIQIENEKKLLLEKLALLKSNEDILLRKIQEARHAAIFEEEKIANIQHDRKSIELEILSMRAQNEGTKIILRNLEEENEKLRQENETLISKRRVYEPREKELSLDIEDRIRFIKNQQQSLRNLRKYETSKLMDSIINILAKKKLKEHFMRIEKHGLLKKLAKKKLYQLALIRRNYVHSVKNRVLQTLRSNFQPLVEQETAGRIIALAHKRRVKAIIWRKWRKATKEIEFTTIRRFQFQNLMVKLSESFSKTNLFAAFNVIKYFRNSPIRERAATVIENIFISFTHRCKTLFMSSLRTAQKQHQINLQIEASSKEQSEMLVMSLYFSAWGKLTKSKRIENMSIKRRYFKQLKKLLALKKRRALGEMLMVTNQKINAVDASSKIFTDLKKMTMISRIEGLHEQHGIIAEKTLTLAEELNQMRLQKKQLYQELALLKVAGYLKRKTQRAFDIWRLRKQQSKVIFSIINMIESKKTFDKNFAFMKILKKRFAMLKKSIRDKIASCEFSYNYLLDENKHIKEILDQKQHELEKSKFMNILKKIVRNEKEIKLKFFYKFMKNGFKYWKFRKTVQNIDKMVIRKCKMVFFWLLKQDQYQIKEQHRIDTFVEEKERVIHHAICKKVLNAFKLVIERNRRFRRVMGGIFQRNLELDFYVAYGKIRNEEHIFNRGLIQADIDHVNGEIDKRNAVSTQQTQIIETLTNRLKQKQEVLVERKILGLYNFFVKNAKSRIGSYIKKWRGRVTRENRVMDFAQILERKSRILLKNKFMLTINKKNEDYTLNQLQDKLKKYQAQYDQFNHMQQKFLNQMEGESTRMKNENITFKKQGQMLEKKTDLMTNIKLKTFEKQWGKKLLKYLFEGWRKQTDKFIDTWSSLENTLNMRVKRENFTYLAKEMKEESLKAKLRRNLSKIYTKTFRANAGLAFKIWRIVYLNKKNHEWTMEEVKQMKRFEGLQAIQENAISRHNHQVDYRTNDVKFRRIMNVWRQYTQKKVKNNVTKGELNQFLLRSYGSEFIRLVKKKVKKSIQFKAKYKEFIEKWQIIRMKTFYSFTASLKVKRKIFDRLFIHKLCPFLMQNVKEDFFHRMKNYIHNKEVNEKGNQTDKIQQVIETFEKKRKSILNVNWRRWRRNEYEMRIAKNLMKRITKNAMNWRIKDLFYTWKLECEAKKVKLMHEEEGEVKKRKIEINRLKVFLEDFKREKGLLLEDEGGQLVVSPRFQEKKEQQIKKDNNMRYKFISRLILSMNGYAAPVKAYNNLRMYMLVREKYKKFAKITRNNLRKPDLFYAFRIWSKAAKDFNKMFDTMERKDLIRILNRQKDKMEMKYSKKLALDDKIHEQMKTHKVLAYQEDKKQKLCAHIFIKNVRKVKTYALFAWKDRVDELKESQLSDLEDKGNIKINTLEEEVNDLEDSERQLRENNQKLQYAVRQALEIAEMVKRITEERDILSNLITQKLMTCESLQEENEQLNAKLYLAQKQAMNLLILSGGRL